MTDLHTLHEAVQQARSDYERAAATFHEAIAEALAGGASATTLAQELGVTRARVYQWAKKAS